MWGFPMQLHPTWPQLYTFNTMSHPADYCGFTWILVLWVWCEFPCTTYTFTTCLYLCGFVWIYAFSGHYGCLAERFTYSDEAHVYSCTFSQSCVSVYICVELYVFCSLRAERRGCSCEMKWIKIHKQQTSKKKYIYIYIHINIHINTQIYTCT